MLLSTSFTLLMGISLASFLFSLFPLLFLISRLLSRKIRRHFSLGPLGLTKPGLPKPHSILVLPSAQPCTLDSERKWVVFVENLPSRGARRTLRSVDAKLHDNGIKMKSIPWGKHHHDFVQSPEVWELIIAHEKNTMGEGMKTWFICRIRLLALIFMDGLIDAYYSRKGELVGFSHSLVKGSALRGMWFYSHPEVKAGVWFSAMKTAFFRALSLKLEIVDFGPSGSDSVMKLKERYGCKTTTSWKQYYDGDFKDI